MTIMTNFKLQVSRKNPDMTDTIMNGGFVQGSHVGGKGGPKCLSFYVTAINFESLHYPSCQIVMDKRL